MTRRPNPLIRWWRHLRFVWPWGHDPITERRRIREDALSTYRDPNRELFQ